MQLWLQFASISTIINIISRPFITTVISVPAFRLSCFLCPAELENDGVCKRGASWLLAACLWPFSLSLKFASVWAQSIQIPRFTANTVPLSRFGLKGPGGFGIWDSEAFRTFQVSFASAFGI